MTEIQKDTGRDGSQSFQEEIVPENYFLGGGRGEVLSQMGEGVQQGVALLILTGEEGSGKTTLCHMFEQQQAAQFVTVFFPRTVDSFDDVVKIIARRLEVSSRVDATGRNWDRTLQEIVECLQQQEKKLLVIFDQAENIYLATLERIRKMLDRVSAFGGNMHILFSGGMNFNENYDQLSICDFARSDELYFSLRPLTADETVVFLLSSTTQLADGSELISDKIAGEISQLAGGNFRRIKELAWQLMSGTARDNAFMVLPEGVEEGTAGQGGSIGKQTAKEKIDHFREVGRQLFGCSKERLTQISGRCAAASSELFEKGRKAVPGMVKSKERLCGLVDRHRSLLPYIGAGACALLLLVVFFNLGNDERHAEQIIQGENAAAEQVAATEDDLVQVEPPGTTDAVESVAAEEMQPESLAEINTGQIDTPVPEIIAQEESAVEQEVAEQQAQPEINTEPSDKLEIQPVVIVENEKTRPLEEKKIQELKPSPSIKNKPPGVSSERGKTTITVQSRRDVQKKSQTGRQYAARQLLEKRMQAGTVWQRGEKENFYTVQLMVLGSKSAEKNLVRMLSEDRYRQEAGNFYILKKKTAPTNLFVFYGEYPSIDTARLAQNSLPQFLRSHKPYTISIKGAVAKVR